MFRTPDALNNEFKPLFHTHRLQISACNVYYQNIRMLNGRHKLLDRDTYKEYFLAALSDIELESSPIDSFVPDTDENSDNLFIVNQIVPEYLEISKRVTLDHIFETLPASHDVYVKLKENRNLLSTVLDDIYIYFSLFKYLDQIDLIRLNIYSNLTPIIEYVVENITIKDYKNYFTSKRINEEKYIKNFSDALFNPDVAHTQKFYSEAHGDIPAIDVVNLMMRLASNIVLQSDKYIIIAIYMTLAFSISDINRGFENGEHRSPCVAYVRDVLSKI